MRVNWIRERGRGRGQVSVRGRVNVRAVEGLGGITRFMVLLDSWSCIGPVRLSSTHTRLA